MDSRRKPHSVACVPFRGGLEVGFPGRRPLLVVFDRPGMIATKSDPKTGAALAWNPTFAEVTSCFQEVWADNVKHVAIRLMRSRVQCPDVRPTAKDLPVTARRASYEFHSVEVFAGQTVGLAILKRPSLPLLVVKQRQQALARQRCDRQSFRRIVAPPAPRRPRIAGRASPCRWSHHHRGHLAATP